MEHSLCQIIEETGDVEIQINAPLKYHTGFRTGGSADYLVMPRTQQAFIHTITTLKNAQQNYYILGNGSNVVAKDEGYRGWIVKTDQALTALEFGRDGDVYAGAGVTLARFCRQCAENGLAGLEFAYGIPGTVGGAVFMNAGAYGGEMQDVVVSVKLLDVDGNIIDLSGEDMQFGYRRSIVQKNNGVIIGARFRLYPDKKSAITARMDAFMQQRKDKQPLEFPSCGSTFKRPTGAFAAKLIDDCGLRGVSVGGAAVSDKHCGFVINKEDATTADILDLAALIQKTVKQHTGFELEKEIRILE